MIEELAIFLQQEEVQFVAGILGIERPLFRRVQTGPVEKEAKLSELRIAAQRRVQRVDSPQRVIGFESRGGNIRQHELLALSNHAHSLLLSKVPVGIESGQQSLIEKLHRFLVQGLVAIGRAGRVDRDNMQILVCAEFVERDANHSVFVRL